MNQLPLPKMPGPLGTVRSQQQRTRKHWATSHQHLPPMPGHKAPKPPQLLRIRWLLVKGVLSAQQATMRSQLAPTPLSIGQMPSPSVHIHRQQPMAHSPSEPTLIPVVTTPSLLDSKPKPPLTIPLCWAQEPSPMVSARELLVLPLNPRALMPWRLV